MTTFDVARTKRVAATGEPAAVYGWENAEVLLVVNDFGQAMPPFDEPDYLVDKRTGELREVYAMLGHDPVPDVRPIGTVPD